MVWLADQNAQRGHYKLGRVVSTNSDQRGIMRDVNVRTFPSYPLSTKKKAPKKQQKDHHSQRYEMFGGPAYHRRTALIETTKCYVSSLGSLTRSSSGRC